MEKTLLYIVRIPRQDEEGPYMEDHYFKTSYGATVFAMKNGIETFDSGYFKNTLADQMAED